MSSNQGGSRMQGAKGSVISRRDLLKTGAAVGLAAAAGSPGRVLAGSQGSITIFHAGSLAPPFSAAESVFEKKTGIQVNREAKGSVASTKKITSIGRRADVLGVSDFRLLRDILLPDYGSWYTVFVTNAMAIQYRPDSPGADRINKDNWWEVLSQPGVRIGHSDPAVDPGGYRAVMA
ncbi:MAG TPA: substrate-binding domain-containing protein, partial [Gammaproteobacteria bacterium]|nr:substrate-binding domain-containing protein [Gammaproteobacteria bacterium]